MEVWLKITFIVAAFVHAAYGADFLMYKNPEDMKIEKNLPNGGKHWALIVAGSNGWFNYRHQVHNKYNAILF